MAGPPTVASTVLGWKPTRVAVTRAVEPVTPRRTNCPRGSVVVAMALPSMRTVAATSGRPVLVSETVPVTAPAWASSCGASG